MDTQIRLQIVNREPFANGEMFGDVGSYECISGTVLFSVNPQNPTNASIVDLNLAPTNPEGLVEFSTDFYILKPLFLNQCEKSITNNGQNYNIRNAFIRTYNNN